MTLRVFATLGRTIAFGLSHFPAFFLLCLLASLPSAVHAMLSPDGFQTSILEGDGGWQADLVTATEIVLLGLVTAVMVRTRIRDQEGESRTVLLAISDTVEYLPTVLGVSFCIAIGTTLFAVMIDVVATIAPILALVPLLIMVVLVLIFAVAMPCAAVDNEGVVDCFGQSAALTLGSRLRIIAVYFLFMIPVLIAGGVIIAFFAPGFQRGELPVSTLFYVVPFFNVFFYAVPVIMHEQLAGLDEGIELSETAAVFD